MLSDHSKRIRQCDQATIIPAGVGRYDDCSVVIDVKILNFSVPRIGINPGMGGNVPTLSRGLKCKNIIEFRLLK